MPESQPSSSWNARERLKTRQPELSAQPGRYGKEPSRPGGAQKPSVAMDLDDGNDARLPFGRAHGSSNPAMLIIGAEDEEFENDIDPNVDDNCSQFQCIDLLKDRPTYLIIFLHHVILQFDASYVLCYLHGEMFKRANVKDARRMFVDYFHTFLDRGAVLRVPVPHDISFELDRCRPDLLCDDGVKNIVKEMQKVTALEIYNQLEDFRNKRMMGMTIGEKELSELDSDRLIDTTTFEMKERLLAEQLLPKVEEATSNTDDEKSTSVYNAVVTYMKFLGVKTKEPRPLEKKRHFLIRRKGPTVRKESEPVRPDEKKRKGIGSILDLRRPPRGDPSTSSSGADVKLDGVKPSIDRKNSSQAGKSQSESSTGRQKPILALPEGSDTAPGSGASHTLSREDSECDPNHPSSSSRAGNENQSFPDCGDSGVPAGSSIEQVLGGEYSQEEGAESERLPAKLRRSESLRAYGERRRSHKGPAKGKQPRSRSDVDLQAAATATHLQGQNSAEPGGSGGPDSQQSFLSAQPEDSGPRVPELEADPPNWRQLVDSETVHRLKKSEVKRQEVINELFITEHAHVRMLKVLYEIFYQRMLAEAILPDTELQNIFPSLDELIEVHVCFYEMIKKLRDEGGYVVMYIGSTLLARFNGTEGDWFKKLASRFCSRQSYALEQIKTRHRKDGRFSQFIQDAESNPQCRRLQLKDIIPIEMQRLTKYPLLLENIAKYTDQPTEKQMVQQAAECCRNILKDVNQEVRETENLRRLHDYQRRLDVSNLRLSPDLSVADFKNIDLTQRRMVHEGPLIWKVTKEKAVDVHVLLLDDILVLMQKVDDKMVLKCHSKNAVGGPDGKQMLCPIIKLGSLLARDVATDRKAFFVLFQTNTGAQIYELVAQTVSERKNWCEWILSTQEALNQQRPSTAPRNSLVPPAVSLPLSPTMMYKEPVLTSDSSICSRDRIHSDFGGRDSDVISQDSGTGELGFDGEVPNVGQALTDVLKANDIDLNKLAQGTSEHIADGALEDVHAMKWQLKTSKRAGREPSALPPRALSEGEQEPGRGTGEAEADEEEEAEVEDGEGSVTEEQQEPERGEELPESQGDEEEPLKGTAEDLHAKEMFPEGTPGSMATDRDTECSRTPVILSLEQAEEMERKMNSVLVKIQHLKAMEEDYHRLRQALLKLTITPRQLTGCQRQAPGEKW